ncbi:YciI family protein [Parasphingorhabdus sp.]|uniref:YciI family protein n=1 Tax=Parasphingorhabdus sp. TaxID=2709688 RepID=UPI003A912CD8
MPKFVFAYHGGPSSLSPEEGQAHMGEWVAWIESMGDGVVDRGLAVGQSRTAGPDGITRDGGANPLSGYTVIEAADMDVALQMASASPHIKVGGTIEVAPVMDMAM